MKELNKKNKFTQQELHVAGIPDPLEGCTLCTKNFIRGRSRMDDNRQVITSSSEVTDVIKKAKTLIDKEKTGKFTP
jgi:hypothetical protein